jgi:hypothetical protein
MRKYRNVRTGCVVQTSCVVKGDDWEEILPEQAPAKPDEGETTEEQAPAKPAKKGNK